MGALNLSQATFEKNKRFGRGFFLFEMIIAGDKLMIQLNKLFIAAFM